MKIIILAGGGGTRLYPLSRSNYPKQFLSIDSDISLLAKTINRYRLIVEPKDILIVSNQKYLFHIKEELAKCNAQDCHIISEPCPRNTAPAIALAVKYCMDKFSSTGKEQFFIAPADHLIEPEEEFVEKVLECMEYTQDGKIVTIGVTPTKPETGYGYIKACQKYKNGFAVESFVEKPDIDRAIEYIENGGYFWNAGMYSFTLSTFFEELKKYHVQLYDYLSIKSYELYPDNFKHTNIPDWLYDEIGGDGTWYNYQNENTKMGFSPNYKNPVLISYHKKLIQAFAARYDNDPRVFMILIGSCGHWGEWHTTYIENTPENSGLFPPIQFSDQYAQHYDDYFTNKPLAMRYPSRVGRDNGMGLFNNAFGDYNQTQRWFLDWIYNGHQDSYNPGYTHPTMPDFWLNAPAGGEFGYYPGTQFLEDSAMPETLRQLKENHISWLGPCCPVHLNIGDPLQKNIDKVMASMGYRFVPSSITHQSSVAPGSTLSLSMTWANKGVAPFYFNWLLELSLSDSNGNIVAKYQTPEDIRTWLPGTKTFESLLAIPANLPDGNYSICAAIIDPETGKPGIDLAISGKRSDGRYPVSSIIISAANSTPIHTLTPTHTVTPTATATPTATTTVPPTAIPVTIYEAEDALLSGKAQVANDHSGYSGTGFVCGYGNVNAAATFRVRIKESGQYKLTVRYANASEADKTLSLYISNTFIQRIYFTRTANWKTWSDQSLIVNLKAGINSVILKRTETDGGTVNIDYIAISRINTPTPIITPTSTPTYTATPTSTGTPTSTNTSTPTSTPTPTPTKFSQKYEAENASLSGKAQFANDHTGYSGSGFICGYGNVGAKALFTVVVPQAGNYIVSIRYANASEANKSLSIYVNGIKITQTYFTRLSNWSTWDDNAEVLNLKRGINTISLQRDEEDGGTVNLDYIIVSQITVPATTPTFTATATPTNTATPTSTPTPTSTSTPTNTPTPTHTPTPTLFTQKYEAENASLSGKAQFANDHMGYSGSGFICGYGNVGAKALFTVVAPKTGNYIVSIRYANASEADKSLSIYVNGSKIMQTYFTRLYNWSTWDDNAEVLNLKRGINTISLQRDEEDGGTVNLDYITVTEIR